MGTPIVVHYSDRWHSVVVRDLIKTNKTSSNKFTIEFQDSNKPDVTLQLTYAPNVLPSNIKPTLPTQGHFFFEKGSTPLLPPAGSRILPGEFVRFDVGVVAGRGSQLKLASKAFKVTSVLAASKNRLFYQGSENVYTLEKKYPLSPLLSVSPVPNELPENWVKHAMTNSRFNSKMDYYVNLMTGESFYGKCETTTEKVLGETKNNDSGETNNGADETNVFPKQDVSLQKDGQEVRGWLRKIDVTGNGGIIKTVIKEGYAEGFNPKLTYRAKYIWRNEPDKIRGNYRTGHVLTKEFRQRIDCMKRGERAIFTFNPPYLGFQEEPDKDEHGVYTLMKCRCRWKSMRGAYYNAEIRGRNEDGTYVVDYLDGDEDLSVERARLLLEPWVINEFSCGLGRSIDGFGFHTSTSGSQAAVGGGGGGNMKQRLLSFYQGMLVFVVCYMYIVSILTVCLVLLFVHSI